MMRFLFVLTLTEGIFRQEACLPQSSLAYSLTTMSNNSFLYFKYINILNKYSIFINWQYSIIIYSPVKSRSCGFDSLLHQRSEEEEEVFTQFKIHRHNPTLKLLITIHFTLESQDVKLTCMSILRHAVISG